MASLGSRTGMLSLVSKGKFKQRNCPMETLFSVPFTKLARSNLPAFVGRSNREAVSALGFRRCRGLNFLGCRNPASPAVAKDFNGVLACGGFGLGMFLACSFKGMVHLSPIFDDTCSSLSTVPGRFGGH